MTNPTREEVERWRNWSKRNWSKASDEEIAIAVQFAVDNWEKPHAMDSDECCTELARRYLALRESEKDLIDAYGDKEREAHERGEEIKRLRDKGIETDLVSREKAERWLVAWHETGLPGIPGRRLMRAYLNALDMRDEIKSAIKEWNLPRVVSIVKRFDGGGDDV